MQRKAYIKKALRTAVWDSNGGADKRRMSCFLECGADIVFESFHCGHVIAEARGGETTRHNLRPICASCNQSMGTQPMNEFARIIGLISPARQAELDSVAMDDLTDSFASLNKYSYSGRQADMDNVADSFANLNMGAPVKSPFFAKPVSPKGYCVPKLRVYDGKCRAGVCSQPLTSFMFCAKHSRAF